MYGRQDDSNNAQPPWLVRAEVTIRHSSPTTSESGQTPVDVSSTVTDSGGVRMIYRWNTSQSPSTPSTPVPSPPPGSYGFQRGNILFTSTPPPRPPPGPPPGSFTFPRSGSSGNDESGYNSERFSPHSYSSLPSRRPSQQYSRRCKSTCSIFLSAVDTTDGSKKDAASRTTTEPGKHACDHSWRHHSSHQHVFSRHQFSTVPEASEEGAEETSSLFATQFSSKDKVTTKTTISKDASSQTTDIESKESSVAFSKSKVRRKAATGLYHLDEQKKKKKQESQSPTASETTSVGPSAESDKSDSSTKDDSGKRKSRTVHIDVYCTGTEDDDEDNTDSSTENECDTPLTVFENPDLRVTHTEAPVDALPRGFLDDKAFLKRATERRCDSFKHPPLRMPSLTSSKGYDSDDVLSSLYPSPFSSYSALRDPDSVPWSAASSNAGVPFDYDSAVATSSKDTFSDIESLLNTGTGLTPCDSFEYASTSDRERIRRMEEIWSKSETGGNRSWRSPQIERRYMLRNRKIRDRLEKHEEGWSSADSGEDTDESGTVGWSFVSSEESQMMVKKTSSVRRSSRSTVESVERNVIEAKEAEPLRRDSQVDRSDSTARSDRIPHYALREQVGPFGSNSPSPRPSKVPSRVTSPFMTPQGERTDHIIKASIFGAVVNAFRKPGHHVGPAKNPSCSCEHCRRHFEELNSRERSSSISEFERQTGFRLHTERKIVRPIPRNCKS
ncbi:dentin sialophosphoprotein [Hylaeus volcanicus]|uniref:dentin sialophosphoprotein n=1 Tax=Hylaeus volcanicus TaxID=313075 RepID=UPI0023B78BE4|nr:dentin sialophosphoprotein [Hylaeus volcanicus]